MHSPGCLALPSAPELAGRSALCGAAMIATRLPGASAAAGGCRPANRRLMNRRLALCFGLLVATAAVADGRPPGSLPAAKTPDIGYRTVAEALAALRLMKDASFSVVRGWTIVSDEAHLTVWSF